MQLQTGQMEEVLCTVPASHGFLLSPPISSLPLSQSTVEGVLGQVSLAWEQVVAKW